jgi:hypothetical protein
MVLHLRTPAPGNWEQAKCAGTVRRGPDDEVYDPFFDLDEADAIEFCNDNGQCPIRDQCLLFALTNNEKSGVWGGTSELDRKALRKRWPLTQRGRNTEPRPEWRWFPPGIPSSWFDVDLLRKELESELEGEDE